MASFIDRCIRTGNWQDDGSAVDIAYFNSALTCFDADLIDATQLKTLFNCTTDQGNELDEIIGQRPSNQNSVPASRWAKMVIAVLDVALFEVSASSTITGLNSAEAVRTALGLSNP